MTKKKKKKKQIQKNPGFNQEQNLKNSVKKMAGTARQAAGLDNNPLYKKNLAALKNRYPELAKKMEETIISSYQLVPAEQSQAPNLLLKNLNRTYYNPANPMNDVKTQLESLGLKNNRLAVFLGIGLGYELLYYAQNMSKKQQTSFILVIERDPQIFKTALHAMDLQFAINNEKMHLMVGMPEEKLYVELRNYLTDKQRFKFLRAMKPVYHHSALMLNKDYYLNALKHLRESGTHQVLNFGNSPEDSLIGVENMLENVGEIVANPGINLLYNQFKGKPAVVIATGPSLNKNKHLLKGLEDKALLVAADASLKVMLDLGVKPHLVTSLERVPATAKLFDGIRADQVNEVYFAGCPVVRNEVYQNFPGPRVIVYRNFDHFKWLGINRGILDIKLSAGNMAFKVAEALGCDPIILIGQDLAYGQEGITHAKGAALGEVQGQNRKRKTLHVKGNNGQPILTNETWYSFLKSYELDVAGYQGTCINSTEGGAYIEGTKVMPFTESINQYIQEPINTLDVIRESLSTFNMEQAQSDIVSLKDNIKRTCADMRSIMDQCNLGLHLYEKHKDYLNNIIASNDDLPESERLNILGTEMLEPKKNCAKVHHHTFQLFMMHILQSYNIKFEMEMLAIPEKYDYDVQASAEKLLRTSEWYVTVRNIAQICLNLLEGSADTLNNVESELSNSEEVCL